MADPSYTPMTLVSNNGQRRLATVSEYGPDSVLIVNQTTFGARVDASFLNRFQFQFAEGGGGTLSIEVQGPSGEWSPYSNAQGDAATGIAENEVYIVNTGVFTGFRCTFDGSDGTAILSVLGWIEQPVAGVDTEERLYELETEVAALETSVGTLDTEVAALQVVTEGMPQFCDFFAVTETLTNTVTTEQIFPRKFAFTAMAIGDQIDFVVATKDTANANGGGITIRAKAGAVTLLAGGGTLQSSGSRFLRGTLVCTASNTAVCIGNSTATVATTIVPQLTEAVMGVGSAFDLQFSAQFANGGGANTVQLVYGIARRMQRVTVNA